MISIDGASYAEVFANLANNTEFNEAERDAARIVAEDLAARDRWDADRHESTQAYWSAGGDPCLDDSPTIWPGKRRYRVSGRDDLKIFEVCGTGICFGVRPYTTGRTMNVGVC